MFQLEGLEIRIFILPILAIVISIHEFSHAYVATKLGDPTPKTFGRVTLNPFAHLDAIGTLALVFLGVGWGKPVPFNPTFLKNPKRDSALIALAGPLSNFLMAVFLAVLLKVFGVYNLTLPNFVYQIFTTLIWLNILLAVFNLLPFDPLDGFKVVLGFLPEDLAYDFMETSRYGIFILLFLLFTNLVDKLVFAPAALIFNLLTNFHL